MRFLVFLLFTLPLFSSAQRGDTAFGFTLHLLDSAGRKMERNAVSDGEEITIQIKVLNPGSWDGKRRYFTILDVLHPDKEVKVLLPDKYERPEEYVIENKDVEINEILIGPPYGLESFLVFFTESPADFRSMFERQTLTRGAASRMEIRDAVEEVLLLLKGSPVSRFYEQTASGVLKTAFVSFVVDRPTSGLTRSGDAKEKDSEIFGKSSVPKNTFYSLDSTQILYSPKATTHVDEKDFPILQIIDPDVNLTRSSRKLESSKLRFRGISVDKESGIKKVTVNGSLAEKANEATGFFEHTYELKEGENKIEISVESKSGYRKTQIFRAEYNSKSQTTNFSSNQYMIVIGIDEYLGFPRLKNAVRDAKQFTELMLSDFGYRKEHIYSLFNLEATADNIYNALDSFSRIMTENDKLLIYYAGHGVYNEKLSLGYWVPSNATRGQLSQLIPNNMIARYLGSMPAKKVFAIIDACYSGTLLEDSKRDADSNTYSQRIREFKCRQVLASGRKEVVADGLGDNSPFATTLMSYLRKVNSNEILSSDIIRHVVRTVPKSEKQTPIGGALRDVNDESGEFEFIRKR